MKPTEVMNMQGETCPKSLTYLTQKIKGKFYEI